MILINQGPDKAIILRARTTLSSILTVKRGNRNSSIIGRGWYAFKEEREKVLSKPSDWIRSALKLDSGVHKRNVLSSGSVGDKLERMVFLQGVIGGNNLSGICLTIRIKTNICKLLA